MHSQGHHTQRGASRGVSGHTLAAPPHLQGVVEDRVSLQQPGGALQTAGRGGEVEAVGRVTYDPQRERGRPGWVQPVDLKLEVRENKEELKSTKKNSS